MMKRMDLFNSVASISEVKNIIENIEFNLYNTNNVEEGGGRDVIFLDNYVIKVPKHSHIKYVDGYYQNMKELEIYLSSKHSNLVPVYTSHLGCLICKRVLDTPLDVYMDKFNLDEDDAYDKLYSDIETKINELMPIINEHNLSLAELKKVSSWGYDKDLNDIVCIDYGLTKPNEDVIAEYIKTIYKDKQKEVEYLLKTLEDLETKSLREQAIASNHIEHAMQEILGFSLNKNLLKKAIIKATV